MPKKTRMRTTFSFKKLQSKFDNIMTEQVNVLTRHINRAIQTNTSAGRGIDLTKKGRAKRFKKLEPTTVALHGAHTPLNVTGKLKETRIIPATVSNDPKAIIEMVTDYGAYQHTGFTQTNPKQWFYGAKVEARPWFGIHKSARPGGKDWKKAQVEMRMRIRSAWSKRR